MASRKTSSNPHRNSLFQSMYGCILARPGYGRQHSDLGLLTKEMARRDCRTRHLNTREKSEHNLPAQLQCTWAVVACDLAEVGVVIVHVNALRIGMVEGIERLEAQVEVHPFAGCEGNGLEYGHVPVLN